MATEKPNDIIVIGQESDGRLIFYLNDRVNRLKATKAEIKELADHKQAEVSWLIIPADDQPEKPTF